MQGFCCGSSYVPWLIKPQMMPELQSEPSSSQAGISLRNDSVQPQAPVTLLKAHISAASCTWRSRIITSVLLMRNNTPSTVEPSWATLTRLRLWWASVMHVAQTTLTPGPACLALHAAHSLRLCRSWPVRSRCSCLIFSYRVSLPL